MSDRRVVVAETLKVHGTLHPDEYERLLKRWTRLGKRLQAFDNVRMDLYVRDRHTDTQGVTLEVSVDGFPKFVTQEAGRDIDQVLTKVRDEMVRLLNEAKERREPRRNRQLRDVI